jgi:D-alanine-D-alanine ligase
MNTVPSPKTRVGFLFGGKSPEHEVSLLSAKNIIAALDTSRFDAVCIGIDKQGVWHYYENKSFVVHADSPTTIALADGGIEVAILPRSTGSELVATATNQSLGTLDCVFPILHGPFGEDGTIQGLLRLANLPFVGPGVLGSAVGMDKDVMKRLLRDADLPIAKFLTYTSATKGEISFEHITATLGLPCFVKPANMGSSVGVSKAHDLASFTEAVTQAFRFDTKILIEEAISGAEVEVSVLGNDKPEASLPGKIVPSHDFYSYEAKYIDEHGAAMEIPAQLSDAVIKNVQDIAIRAFTTLSCEGMARVDMFVTPEGNAVINEINTIPGFTKISMYPKLWEASGLAYTDLISRLIELAVERHQQQAALQTSYAQ